MILADLSETLSVRRDTHLSTTEAGGVQVAKGVSHLVGRIRNGHNKVGDRVHADFQITLLTHPTGDLQHFVVDHVAQVVATQDQVQGTLHLDAVDIDRHQAVRGRGFFFHPLGVQVDVDFSNRLDLLDHVAQRNLVFVQRDSLAQALLDLQLFRTTLAIVGAVLAFASIRDFFPVFAEIERVIIGHVDDHTLFDIIQLLPERFFLVELQLVVASLAASESCLPEQRFCSAVFRVHFFQLLRNDFRFGESLLFVEVVEFLDHLGHVLLDPDLGRNGAFHSSNCIRVPLLQLQVRLLTDDFRLQSRACLGQLLHQIVGGFGWQIRTFNLGHGLIDQAQRRFWIFIL